VIRVDDKKLVEDDCTVMKPFSEVTKFHGIYVPVLLLDIKQLKQD
jgi:hypothetical protein